MSEKSLTTKDMPVIKAHVSHEMKADFLKKCQYEYQSESAVIRRLIKQYLKGD